MTPSPTKRIERWKIVPTTGETVSPVGLVNGIEIQTTPICYGRLGEVRTENSHYILGEKLPGMWEIQLEMRRPQKVSNLRRHGVL